MVFVVRVDLRVIASPRQGHIRQTPIHEFFSGLLGVHPVGGLSLAAVARYCIAVVEMWILFDVECNSPA
jgi:hypothetical protein